MDMKMKMPGFNAETSLYKTSRHYHMAATGSATAAGVLPQHFLGGGGEAFSPFGMGGLSIVGGFGGPGIMAFSWCQVGCVALGAVCVGLCTVFTGPAVPVCITACVVATAACVATC